METTKKRLDYMSKLRPFRISVLIFFSCTLMSNLFGQVTTEKIVSNAEELRNRDFTAVTVVKYEPQNTSFSVAQADSSGIAKLPQSTSTDIPKAEYGFVKSEFVKVFPEAVNTDAKGEQNIDYYKLIPIMFKIIQDQNDKIKTLENQVSEL
jgi:hypothetical protein